MRSFVFLLPLAYILFLIGFYPIGSVIEYGPDEGFELMKSFMVHKGFHVYGPMWNDQPPLHTLLLAALFDLFGSSAGVARGLNLFFSWMLLTSFAWIILLSARPIYALFGVLTLITSHHFLELSLSAMLEVPVMAVGLFSVALLFSYLQNRKMYLFWGSSVFFALALQTKLTGVLLLPVFIISFLEKENKVSKKSMIYWFLTSGLVFASVMLVTKEDFSIFFQSHGQRNFGSSFDIFQFLWSQASVALLTLAASAVSFSFRGFYLKVFVFLFLFILCVHSYHRPFWYYYELHMYIAFSLLVSQWIFEAIQDNSENKRITQFFSLLCFLIICMRLYDFNKNIGKFSRKGLAIESNTLKIIRENKDETHWMYSDKLNYAFHAQIKMPPELVVVPLKRIQAGLFQESDKISLLQKYQPEQILLFHWKKASSQLKSFVNSRYQKISKDRQPPLFLRKDIYEKQKD